MGKTTRTVKVTGFTFFFFLLISASNSAPTELDRLTPLNKNLIIAAAINADPLNDPNPVENNGEGGVVCSIIAPKDISDALTSDDGNGDCATVVDIGKPSLTGCSDPTAKPFVNDVEINPKTYLFPVGTTVVTWKLMDGSDSPANDTQSVTVTDNEAPVVKTKDIDVQLDVNGTASIVPADIDNGSTDNCEIISYSLNIDSFSCADVNNPVTVTLTATDAEGTQGSEPAVVTVYDNVAPTVVTQDITIQLDATGTASITTADIDNGSTDACGIADLSLDITEFDCSNIGDNIVTLTVTDVNGNSSSSTATVKVQDKIAPTVVTQNITVQLDALGSASITAAEIDNGSSDNCNNITLSLDKYNFDCSTVGDNTVTLTVTDNNDNSSSGTAIVTVEDNIAPTVITKNVTIQLDANGTASIAAADINNGSSDACNIAEMTLDKYDFNCSDLGENTVNLTVKDSNGNSDTQPAVVTVEDKPTVVTQNITIQLDSNGTASITVADIDDGSFDACGTIEMALDKYDFDCSNLGSNTVTLSVTDEDDNTSTGTATVTVRDDILPYISAPANITNAQTSDDGSGNCSTTVQLGYPVTADNCSVSSIKAFVNDTEIYPDTHPFPIGTTAIKWVVKDAFGNTSTDTQEVTVEDDEKPILNIPDNLTVGADENSCSATNVYIGEATATDNCSTEVSISNNAPDVYNLGETEVVWTAVDSIGNSVTAIQVITVEDREEPTITAPADITGIKTSDDGTGDCYTTVDLGTPQAGDSCGSPDIKAYIDGSPINPNTHLFPPGTTTVTWEATDSRNRTTDTQTVTVIDDEAPIISSPADVLAKTSDDGRGDCTTTVNLGFPTTTDNCNSISTKAYIGNVEIDPDLHKFPVGTTTVTWTATDPSNNQSSTTQEVTVKDDEAPIPQNLHTINWGCTFDVPIPTATDNCDDSITVTANRSTTFSSSGKIEWTFTDAEGNSTTAEQTINIDPLTATTSSTRTTVYGKNDGTAKIEPQGGISPYTYEWKPVGDTTLISTAKEAVNLAEGLYEVTAYDVNGCAVTEQVEIVSAVLPEHTATSACDDVQDSIRSSTFEIDLNNVTGGVGDPENFIYEWNFGLDATPETAVGPEKHTVTWENSGDKVVYLRITDESGFKQTYPIEHYVGGCFEGCGATSNFKMDTENFFIGDKDGNPLTGDDCHQVTEKYMWIDIIDNANGYSLSAEMNYAVNNGQETITGKAIGCFSELAGYDNQGDPIYEKIPTGLFRLFQVQETGTASDKITWQCGSTFTVEGINIRWTNNQKNGCNEGTQPMCYGPTQEVVVNTPLVVEATKEDVSCKGGATGSISIHAAGGLAPYTYSIDGTVSRPYQDSQYFYNLPAGDYIYRAKDTDTVITSGTLTIYEPARELSTSVEVTQVIGCNGGTGEATVTATGGTSPYSYSWSSGAVTRTATGLYADVTYTVTVIDANGCRDTDQITLSQPERLTSAFAGRDQSFGCGITSTTLSANNPSTGEKGQWEIISGSNGNLSSTDVGNPNAAFSGSPGESYVLQWTISKEDGSCPNSDQVSISFASECNTLDFDGLDDYVTMGDTYDLQGTNFTIEAWVRPKSVDGSRTIVSKRNTGNMGSGGYDLSIVNGAVNFGWNNNRVFTTNKVGTDRWYHIAVIFSGQSPQILVDGIPLPVQSDIPNAASPAATSYPFIIGAANYQDTPEKLKNHFHGWIEEVRIWNTAISLEQLRFMMNQRVIKDGENVKGEVLPMKIPGNLLWSSLSGYYRLKVPEIDEINGTTPDISSAPVVGFLRNIDNVQQNSAPLPYVSAQNGNWWNPNSWLYSEYWNPPNSTGINGEKISWNIAYVSDTLNSGNQNIELLGLLLKAGELNMLGTNPSSVEQAGTGNGLTITKFLDLDGFIDLNGESQLIQPVGSILAGTGRLDRDQQGTGSSFNYNYFSSPVSSLGNPSNSGFSVADVLRSGTDPENPSLIDFNYQYHYADGPLSNPLKISTYWLYKFHGTAGNYNQWHWIGENGHLEAGEGYTMKGSSGHLDVLDLQNYVFTGMPNNGLISFSVGTNENRLLGNPYPSAIDAKKFIEQNLKDENGNYIFNGSLYFWSHFKNKSHYLTKYVGGYAIYNLMGSAKAVANDSRINATGETGGMEPQQYIPPGQAFFINTVEDNEVPEGSDKAPLPVGMVGGEIRFSNSQREFQKENPTRAVFHSQEKPQAATTGSNSAETVEEDTRKKIWLKSRSPLGYHRQLLVGVDTNASMAYDPGYDAPLHDEVEEDMYWKLDHRELVIQGVHQFARGIELPLELKVKKEGEFTIEIDKLENIPRDFEIFLKDTVGNYRHNLKEATFKFNATPGTISKRFSIIFLNDKEPEKELEKEVSTPFTLFYSKDEKAITIINPELIPIYQANIYNLNAQHLRRYDYIPKDQLVKLSVPIKTTGVYIIRLETEVGIKILKFMISK